MTDERSKTDVSSDEVIRKYFDTVYKLALSQTKNQTFAEDVTQDVFVRLINCSKSVFMSSWFKKIVPLEEDLTFDNPEKSDVYFAVQDLPLKYRTVIHLFYYEDMSVREIAESIDIKESTVKSHLHRGRMLLKNKLKGDYDFV